MSGFKIRRNAFKIIEKKIQTKYKFSNCILSNFKIFFLPWPDFENHFSETKLITKIYVQQHYSEYLL